MAALTAALPMTFTLGDATWERDTSQDLPEPIEAGNSGLSTRAVYTSDGGEATFTYAVFDTRDNAATYYSERSRSSRNSSLRLNLAGSGAPLEGFPTPNVAISGEAYAGAGLFQVNEVFVVEVSVELAGHPGDDPLAAFAQQALDILQASLSAEAGGTGDAVPAATEAPTAEPTPESAATPEVTGTQQIAG
jgi:hypothetical protein